MEHRLLWIVAIALAAALLACGSKPTPQTLILHVYDTPTVSAVGIVGGATVTPVIATRSAIAPTLSAASAQTCALIRLTPGEHISSSDSYTMTEDEAAGQMMCHIERDSCAYSLLMVDRDPEIQFNQHKPAPYTEEDRQMHPAMLLPLSRLRDLVQTEWKGEARLFVTAVYDSTGEHDLAQSDPARKYSLHFEGRSIDLITVPATSERIDRLCALAHCAGFDWVNNEGDHCHASINAPSLCTYCSGVGPRPSNTPTP